MAISGLPQLLVGIFCSFATPYFREFLENFLAIHESRYSTDMSVNNEDFHYEKGFINSENGSTVGYTLITSKLCKKPTEKRYYIMIHGRGCNRTIFSHIFQHCSTFTENSCFLLIDYGGFGDSTGQYSIHQANCDITAAMEYLNRRFNAQKINMIGHSHGCAIILEYVRYVISQELTKIYDSIILLSPYLSVKEIYKSCFPVLYSLFPEILPEIEKNFSYENYKHIKLVDPNKILLIHGKKDEYVPLEHSKNLLKAAKCKHLHTNDGHSSILENNRVWEHVDSFLKSAKNLVS